MEIKIKRVIRGLTQYDLMAETGIPQSRLSLIERGYIIPKDEEKTKLAQCLGCKEKDLFPEN